MEADASSKLYSQHIESQFNQSWASVPTSELWYPTAAWWNWKVKLHTWSMRQQMQENV